MRSRGKSAPSPSPSPEDTPPLAPNTEEGKKAYESVLRHGFPSFPKPVNKEDPDVFRVLPDQLSSMSSDDLADEMGYWTAMQNYAAEQAALIWNDLEANKRKLEKYVDGMLARVSGGTITERKARARSTSDANALQDRVDHLQSVYNLVDAIRGNCERNYAAVSRVVSTREASAE